MVVRVLVPCLLLYSGRFGVVFVVHEYNSTLLSLFQAVFCTALCTALYIKYIGDVAYALP